MHLYKQRTINYKRKAKFSFDVRRSLYIQSSSDENKITQIDIKLLSNVTLESECKIIRFCQIKVKVGDFAKHIE